MPPSEAGEELLPVLRLPDTERVEADILMRRYDASKVSALLANSIRSAQKNRKPLSILVCDPDRFNIVNTTFGQEVGDRALNGLGAWLRSRLRGHDIALRYKESSFLLILRDAPIDVAKAVAERMRSQLSASSFSIGTGRPLHVEVSVGCAALSPSNGDVTRLIDAAVGALRRAKGEGRNRVAAAPSNSRGEQGRGPPDGRWGLKPVRCC